MINKVFLSNPKRISFVECQNSLSNSDFLNNWWTEHLKKNPNLFNGKLLACDKVDSDGSGNLTIHWYKTNYAHYRLRTDASPTFDYARAIFCSVAVTTNEGEVVFGRMASNTSDPGRLQLAGGNIEINDIGNIDIESCKLNALRELQEEIGIVLDENEIQLWRVKLYGEFGDVGFIFKNKVPISRDKIFTLFDAHKLKIEQLGQVPEFPSLEFIRFGEASSLVNEKVVDYGENVILEMSHSP